METAELICLIGLEKEKEVRKRRMEKQNERECKRIVKDIEKIDTGQGEASNSIEPVTNTKKAAHFH